MAWRVREIGDSKDKAILELEGVVDSTNVEDFLVFINSIFKQGINRIVLDLEFTGYLSSGALSVIADAYNKADKVGGKLVIARASDMVSDLFSVVQFKKIMEFYEDLDAAIDAV
jgi:anti-anti-sigma factor